MRHKLCHLHKSLPGYLRQSRCGTKAEVLSLPADCKGAPALPARLPTILGGREHRQGLPSRCFSQHRFSLCLWTFCLWTEFHPMGNRLSIVTCSASWLFSFLHFKPLPQSQTLCLYHPTPFPNPPVPQACETHSAFPPPLCLEFQTGWSTADHCTLGLCGIYTLHCPLAAVLATPRLLPHPSMEAHPFHSTILATWSTSMQLTHLL